MNDIAAFFASGFAERFECIDPTPQRPFERAGQRGFPMHQQGRLRLTRTSVACRCGIASVRRISARAPAMRESASACKWARMFLEDLS
jgi:hypothetical protein